MYIMCVCLFSALSRRVGALQMSITKDKPSSGLKCSRAVFLFSRQRVKGNNGVFLTSVLRNCVKVQVVVLGPC